MKHGFFGIALIWSSTLLASGPFPTWSEWGLEAHSTGCALKKDYRALYEDKPVPQGFLADTKFYRAHIRFKAHTFTHGNIITHDELGVIRFVLQFDPVSSKRISNRDKISHAVIGGYESLATVYEKHDIHQFWLSEPESLELLQKIERNEIVEFSLTFADGESREFSIYPSLLNNGHVWVAMFHTCIKEHVRR